MPGPVLATQAIVLRKAPLGERFVAYDLLSPESGSLRALRRRSSRQPSPASVDLFDQGVFHVETPRDAAFGFLKEATVQRRRAAIAASYASLEAASLFARLLLANPLHPEHAGAAYRLLEKGLDAWERAAAPHCALLKCLFQLCRDEGYAVEKQWLRRLPQADRDAAARILNRPTSELAERETEAARLRMGLLAFMSEKAHFRLPP